jgi:uncharacterized membrane protein YdjX (TVP38/TMEM64 family)
MSNDMPARERLRRPLRFDYIAQITWLLLCILLGGFFYFNPHLIDPETVKHGISSYGAAAVYVYIIVSMVRGFFLLPSTPLVLAGAAMYPDQPLMVISISMGGILFSATLLYFFSEKLGFANFIEYKYPQAVKSAKELLSGNKALLFVAGWSFFPLVPTDVVCYAAGVIKMPFTKMITGLFIGELLLVSLYVYLGKGILSLL